MVNNVTNLFSNSNHVRGGGYLSVDGGMTWDKIAIYYLMWPVTILLPWLMNLGVPKED